MNNFVNLQSEPLEVTMTSPTRQTPESQGSRRGSPIQSAGTGLMTTDLVKEEQPYSRDPFAPNYRHFFPNIDRQGKDDWVRAWPLPLRASYWEIIESAEHAEFTRTRDQLNVLLRQRGMYEQFYDIVYNLRNKAGDDETKTLVEEQDRDRVAEAREYLKTAVDSEELVWRAEEVWRLEKWRQPVARGDLKAETLLEVGDVVGYKWSRMMEDMHDWEKIGVKVATAGESARKG